MIEGRKMTAKKPLICNWCFEKPAVEGKTVCQGCIDAINKENEENKNFDIDKWLDETEEEMTERRFNNEHGANR